jgi:Do/DeqQ family serine protease
MKQGIKTLSIGLIGGLIGSLGYGYFQASSSDALSYIQNQTPFQSASTVSHSQIGMNTDFVEASKLGTPSVVFIKNISQQSQNYDMFGWFFGGGGGSQTQVSTGSGVIINKNGYIITNNHVIDNAEQIEVVHEKRTYSAKVVGTDPSSDLAVLKIDAENLPAIKIGSSKATQVGEWVLAVGNPFNLNSTVTAGIISAKGRDINVVSGRFPLESFIQTDAAINPGNSGGALVNIKGELIGINTAILSHTGSYSGYGFAVPADIAMKVVKDILEFGEVQKSFFGAEVSDLNTQLGDKLHTSNLSGVAITYLQKDAAAEKSGLLKGDIVTAVDDVSINSKAEFDEQISYYRPGNKIKVSYRREDKIGEVTLLLTNREGTTSLLKREVYSSVALGADLEAVSKVERDKLGLESGIRIAKVKSGLVQRMGITEGFIITAVNSKKMTSPEELSKTLEKLRGRVVIEGISANGQRGYYSFIF